jgi:hypothetical protein
VLGLVVLAGALVQRDPWVVDVLLVAWIGENYYPAMAAVLKASERGELDVALLRESEERLEAAAGRLRGRVRGRPR